MFTAGAMDKALRGLRVQISTRSIDCAAIGLLAITVAIAWAVIVPIAFYTDSWGYYLYAKFIGIQAGGALPSHRTPGYPLMVLLTGVTKLDSLAVLLAAQFLMAVAMPVLAYLAVEPFSRKAAITCGVVTTITMLPFIYQKWVMTEQPFLFCTMLIAFLVARLSMRGSHGVLFLAITLVSIALALVKPQGTLIFWLTAILCLVMLRKLRPWILGGMLAFSAAMAMWAVIDRQYLLRAGAFPEIFPPSRAEQRLGELYFEPRIYCPSVVDDCPAILNAQAGPASAELYKIVNESIKTRRREPPTSNDLMPQILFSNLPEHGSDSLESRIWRRPHFAYWQFISSSVALRLGASQRDELFGKVAAEYGNRGINGAFRFLRNNPTAFLFGGAPRAGGYNLFWQFYGPGRYLRTLDIYRPTRLVRPENGPSSKALFDGLRAYLTAFPKYWEPLYPQYVGHVNELIEEMFESPRFEHLWRIWNMMASQLTIASADKLFRSVVKETAMRHPESTIILWDNASTAAFGPGSNSDDGYRLLSLPYIGQSQYVPEEMPARLREELLLTAQKPVPLPKLFDWLYQSAHVLKPIYFLISICVVPVLWNSRARLFGIWLITVTAVQIAVIALFGTPTARYMDMVLLLPLMGSMLGMWLLKEERSNNAEHPTVQKAV